MKQKFYHMHGKTTDQNGQEHIVTIVGEYTQYTDHDVEVKSINVHTDYNRVEDSILIQNKNQKMRKLRYAYSICHPHDVPTFNEEVGVAIAKRRIKDNPLGELTTTFRTTLCEDQIQLILFGELKHVMDNVDKFIDRL